MITNRADAPEKDPEVVTKPAKIAALIVVHNRLAYTKRCLAALVQSSRAVQLQLILVDDGSTDGTTEWVRQEYPATMILSGDGTLWFGGGADLGLAYIRFHYSDFHFVLILNNDTYLREGALDTMVAASEGGINSVAGTVWIEDRRVPGTSGFTWHSWRGLEDCCLKESWRLANAAQENRFLLVDAVATTLVLHPLKVLSRLDPIDTRRHPQNRYDAMLSARVRAKGARFVVSTRILADHTYGELRRRPSLRSCSWTDFWRETFVDAHSVFHFPHTVSMIWAAAPSRIEALPVVLRQSGLLLRAFAGKVLISLAGSLGVRRLP